MLFRSGEISPTPGSPLSRFLSGSRSGHPVGLDLLDEDPFFVYAHRLGWGGADDWVEGLSYSAGYLLEGTVESEKQRKALQKSLREFFSLTFGDLTLAVHTLSLRKNAKKSHLMGAAAVGRVRDAKKLRSAFIALVERIKKLQVRSLFTRRDLMAVKSCVEVKAGVQRVEGRKEDWVKIDYDGVRCPGPLPLALTFAFGKPALEMAFHARGSTLLWTCGPDAKERLVAMAKRKKVNKKGGTKSSRMAQALSKRRASGWILFSPATFIRETSLFGMTGTKRWVNAAKGLEGPGGVSLSWGTRQPRKKSHREAFVRFRIDNRELGRLFQVLLKSKQGVLGTLMRSGTNR